LFFTEKQFACKMSDEKHKYAFLVALEYNYRKQHIPRRKMMPVNGYVPNNTSPSKNRLAKRAGRVEKDAPETRNWGGRERNASKKCE
jgi:hypothetical protein